MGCPQPEWAYAISHSAFPTNLDTDRHSEDYLSFLVGFVGGMTIQMDTSAVIPTWEDCAWDLSLRVLISIEGHLTGRNSPPSFDKP